MPPQRGELDDLAERLLAFACMAAHKTTRPRNKDPEWAKPSKDSWPIGEYQKEDLKQLLCHRVENLQQNHKRVQWREKQLKLTTKWGTSIYVPEYNNDRSGCTCEYQGPRQMSHVCHCNRASTLTLREVSKLLQKWAIKAGKNRPTAAKSATEVLISVGFIKSTLKRLKKYSRSSRSSHKAIWLLLRTSRGRSRHTIPESPKPSQGRKKPLGCYHTPDQATNWSGWT